MKHIYQGLLTLTSFLFFIAAVGVILVGVAWWNPFRPEIPDPSVLSLKLDGVILGEGDFLNKLRFYRQDPNVKGVIIEINSPGGLVGSSQEIYSEIKRTKEEFRQPVVVAGGNLLVSGAYYAAVAADRILIQPGTLLGSFNVIWNDDFVNMSIDKKSDLTELSSLAEKKIDVDGGINPVRVQNIKMSAKESVHHILDEMHDQFKQVMQKHRSLSSDVVNKYSDGRVFTGETAVRLGFADQIGTYEDAVRLVGNLAGLGSQPKIFQPRFSQEMTLIEKWRLLYRSENNNIKLSAKTAKDLQVHLAGRPLYLMPGTL